MNKLELIREKMKLKYPIVLNKEIRKQVKQQPEDFSDMMLKEKKDRLVITFSLDKKIVEELRYYCEKEGMYMSALVTRAIKKYLEEK